MRICHTGLYKLKKDVVSFISKVVTHIVLGKYLLKTDGAIKRFVSKQATVKEKRGGATENNPESNSDIYNNSESRTWLMDAHAWKDD